ncbi:hypothetical protein T08_15402 [Trichinella sp. T8]|nr:hypothetical protein T08_15402 [Trichinella sp. T8]
MKKAYTYGYACMRAQGFENCFLRTLLAFFDLHYEYPLSLFLSSSSSSSPFPVPIFAQKNIFIAPSSTERFFDREICYVHIESAILLMRIKISTPSLSRRIVLLPPNEVHRMTSRISASQEDR